jgi:GNAT superfamily N-acetyltransferase
LYGESEDEIYLRQFFVVRSLRRRGIGRQALRLLITHIWPYTKRLTVSVHTHNTAGLRFWPAIGFTDDALTLEILPKGSAHA